MTVLKNENLPNWFAPSIIAIGFLGIMLLHLVPAYLIGLFSFFAIRKMAALMPRRWSTRVSRWVALLILILLLGFGFFTLFSWGIVHVRAAISGGALERTLALGWQRFLNSMPLTLSQYFPQTLANLQDELTDLLGTHWGTVGALSRAGFHGIVLGVVGFVVGALIAFEPYHYYQGVFADLSTEVRRAAQAFWEVISAQVLISTFNTIFTSIYLLLILPALNIKLPYPMLLVMITFIAGLIPILGNLISNTVILLISFTVSAYVALCSFIFLVVIHKLEYFLNAKIIGVHIKAKPWELLIAFFVGDAAFGLPGIMVAPFFYGYYKLLLHDNAIKSVKSTMPQPGH